MVTAEKIMQLHSDIAKRALQLLVQELSKGSKEKVKRSEAQQEEVQLFMRGKIVGVLKTSQVQQRYFFSA
jgi:flagellin-like hook-associated protein FlgL